MGTIGLRHWTGGKHLHLMMKQTYMKVLETLQDHASTSKLNGMGVQLPMYQLAY